MVKKSKEERNYKELPIEEKESHRWLQSAITRKSNLESADLITVIGDSESDIYDELALVPDKKTHLLIRSCWNRRLASQDCGLFEYLASLPVSATYSFTVKGNRKRKSRCTQMELRFSEVTIARPLKHSNSNLPSSVTLNAIEACEQGCSVPDGESPIRWRLLTTHNVSSAEDALQCIEWYAMRWQIEELFRILKSQGLDIESSQLETGKALKKLAVISLQAALKIMQLTLARDGMCDITTEAVFTEKEIRFQKILLSKLEGKTAKQQNPHAKDNLAWSSWIIARLGGWKGYKSSSVPGHITMKRGLAAFYQKFEGWEIALQYLL